jgi:hypothetical protein
VKLSRITYISVPFVFFALMVLIQTMLLLLWTELTHTTGWLSIGIGLLFGVCVWWFITIIYSYGYKEGAANVDVRL